MAFLEYQQAFINEYLSPEAFPWQLLVASPGMGKTTIALEIIQRVHKSQPRGRILFLGAGPLATQAAEILQGRMSSSEAFYFSRQRLRELDAASLDSEWPTRIVAIGHNVANQPQVLKKLRSSRWDLVVIDDADRFTNLVESLMPYLSDTRVLLLSGAAVPPTEQITSAFKVTQLRADRLSDSRQLTERTISFKRSAAEHTVLERLSALRVELNETREASRFWQILQQAADSSFNALEQLLTRQLSFLSNSIATESRTSGMPEDFATTDIDIGADVWKDQTIAVEVVLSVLEAISGASRDEKLSAMLGVVDSIGLRDRYAIWIVTSFRATAWYVGSSLSERGWRATVLTAGMSYLRVVEASAESNEKRSIVVATVASTKGLYFPGISHVILYDEPRWNSVMNAILTRVPEGLTIEISVLREAEESRATIASDV